jgi:hypothetical protein
MLHKEVLVTNLDGPSRNNAVPESRVGAGNLSCKPVWPRKSAVSSDIALTASPRQLGSSKALISKTLKKITQKTQQKRLSSPKPT